MSSILQKLKKSSRASLESLANSIGSEGEANSFKDERYWAPVVDKANVGNAVIRFLPAVSVPTENVSEPEDMPYVKMQSFGFKDKGGWYIENSRQTIGQADPVNEHWSELWNAGQKEEAKKFARRMFYIMNILVVKHTARPEDEGKVFLYKCPKTIFDKIKAKLKPDDGDDEPENVLDLWEGRNFKMKIRDKAGFRNYEQSEWDSPSPVADDDDDIEKIFNSEYSLQAEIAPDKFKPYDELKKQLDRVLNGGSKGDDEDRPTNTKTKASKPAEDTDNDPPFEADPPKTKKAEPEPDDDEDDFFKKLKARTGRK